MKETKKTSLKDKTAGSRNAKYSAPKLTKYGRLKELTRGSATKGAGPDDAFTRAGT